MLHRIARLAVVQGTMIAVGLLAAPMVAAQNQERTVPSGPGEVMWSFAPLVREASPAVVNIFTKSIVASRVDSFNSPFDDSRRRRDQALGSGVIVSDDGIVVTNAHVIEGADEIEVALTSGDSYVAEVLFEDERTDIAILQLQEDGVIFPTLPIGDSDQVQIGDFVLAIGNPFGVGQSTSMGIVSALNRTDLDVIDTGSFIQTDAAINPGNSGGALIDINGQLVGINSAILGRTNAGIGWAIPSNFVRATLDALRAGGGNLVRPWLGLQGQTVTRQLAAAQGLQASSGVVVESIFPGSPGDLVGLRQGDIIINVDGRPLRNFEELEFAFANKLVGEQMLLTVVDGTSQFDVMLTMIAPAENPARNPTQITGRNPMEGLTVINVNPAVIEEYGLRNVTGGVVVINVPVNSIAARMRSLRVGDVVVSMQGTSVESIEDVVRQSQQRTRRWSFELIRDGRRVSVRTIL